MSQKRSILDEPLKITIIPVGQRRPIDPLEFALDRWGVLGQAINAASLEVDP
jgi:hypothetical protein